jgi:hypothetical protein
VRRQRPPQSRAKKLTVVKPDLRMDPATVLRPIMRAPGAPDFSPQFERLLILANVEKTVDSQVNLDVALKSAWSAYRLYRVSRAYPPKALLDRLDLAIRRMKILLREVEGHSRSRDIAFDVCPVGAGTVSVKTVREMILGEDVSVPRRPPPLGPRIDELDPDGSVAAINIYGLLERLRRNMSIHRRPRARPPELGKAAIVAYAASFFRKHSASKITGYSSRKAEGRRSGDFVLFCKAFYEAVTGQSDVDVDALQAQIKAAVKTPGYGFK